MHNYFNSVYFSNDLFNVFSFRCIAFFFNETSHACHFTAMASESLIPYDKLSPMPKIYVNTKYQNCKIFQFWNEVHLIVDTDLNTVKPVYIGHLWDLKNVVIMYRFVWKLSVVSKLQTGRYGFWLAVVDRWPLFGGGC